MTTICLLTVKASNETTYVFVWLALVMKAPSENKRYIILFENR